MGINHGDHRRDPPSLQQRLKEAVHDFLQYSKSELEEGWYQTQGSVCDIVRVVKDKMWLVILLGGASYVCCTFPEGKYRVPSHQEQREDDLDASIEKGWRHAYTEVYRAVALWANNDPEHRTQIMRDFLSACLAEKPFIRSSVHQYQKENPGFSSPEITARETSFAHMQNIAEAHGLTLKRLTRERP